MQRKIDHGRQAERKTSTKSRQLAGRMPGISRTLAGEGFPQAKQQASCLTSTLLCGLATISQTSIFCFHMWLVLQLPCSDWGVGLWIQTQCIPFHSNTILLDLLKFRQPNEGLQRQPGKRIILAGGCQDSKARFRGALLGPQSQIQSSFFFSPHTGAQRNNWVYGYNTWNVTDLIWSQKLKGQA